MRDTTESSPDIILARQRAGRSQATLNIELGLTNKAPSSSGTGGGSSGGGAVGGSQIISGLSGGGDGGGGDRIPCFAGSTLVRMDDNEKRPIYVLPIGLSVAAPDENGHLCSGRITGRQEKEYYSWLRVRFADERCVEVRPNHRYRTEGGLWVNILDADHVMHFTDRGWKRIAVKERARIEVKTPRIFYNLEIEGYGAYLAADDWVSNKKIDEFNNF